MRSVLIVIDSPRFTLLSRIVSRHEHLRVHTLVPKPSVETLNYRILHRFVEPDDIEVHPPSSYAQASSTFEAHSLPGAVKREA